MSRKARVIGVDMVKFTKPGTQHPYEIMASNAVQGAIKDAGIEYKDIQQAYASYVYGDSAAGQTALYKIGLTGIPVFNVNNDCGSGSTALYLARQAVENGSVDCALAFGFEEMVAGALQDSWTDRTSPLESFTNRLSEIDPFHPEIPMAIRFFGVAGNQYLEKYNANPDIFAKVAVKTRNHAINNPYSMFNIPLSVEEVMSSPVIYPPFLTRLCACPPSCGAAAVILCTPEFAKKHGLNDSIEIASQSMVSDIEESFNTDAINLVGSGMTKRASRDVYEEAGISPEDIDVIELHDCFTPNEIITYEALGLCGEGESEDFINKGDNTYRGKFVVNPSGGLMSKGHPLGATGLAQCTELVWHLRGVAGKRQVENARIALQHDVGLGGVSVVTLYKKN